MKINKAKLRTTIATIKRASKTIRLIKLRKRI